LNAVDSNAPHYHYSYRYYPYSYGYGPQEVLESSHEDAPARAPVSSADSDDSDKL
jgi:hypothetical protein